MEAVEHRTQDGKKRTEDIFLEPESCRSLLNDTGVSACTIDMKGRFTYANRQLADLLGYSVEELLRRSFLEFLHPDDKRRVMRLFANIILLRRNPRELEFRVICKDGSIRHLLTKPTKSKTEAKTVGFQAIMVDITQRKQTEQTLRESEEKYRAIVENSPNFVVIIQDRSLKYMNRAGCEIAGRTLEELTSPSFNFTEKLIAKKYRDLVTKNVEKRLRGKSIAPYEISLLARDGSEIPVIVRAQRISYRGKPAIEAILIDITERKKMEDELRRHSEQLEEMVEKRTAELQQSEEKYRDLFDNANDLILSVNSDFKFAYVNRKWLETLGYNKEEVKQLRLMDIMRRDEIERCKKLFRKIADGENPPLVETVFVSKGGGEIFVEGTVNCQLVDAKFVAARGIFRDVTDRKRAEELKDRFISTVTHELRTPLVSIRGYTDYVFAGMSGPVPKEIMENVEVVKRNADRLLNLTNDLLDIQRIQAGKTQLNLQQVNVKEIISQAAEEAKPLIDQKKQNLSLEVPEKSLNVLADPARLSQVFANLLSNAVKFSPEGGTIILRATEKDDSAYVRVSDSGIGIRKGDLARVFEPFAAIEKPSYIKGTGLGLSVTKGLVEAHGGKIWAESPGEGKGATFTFTLPKWKEVK